MSGVPELTVNEFDKFTEKGLVLVDFFAEWCMPCLMMGPVVDELADKFKGKINFAKVNVEDNSPLSAKFSISSIPCFILFKDGEILERFVGAMSSEDFEERLNEFL